MNLSIRRKLELLSMRRQFREQLKLISSTSFFCFLPTWEVEIERENSSLKLLKITRSGDVGKGLFAKESYFARICICTVLMSNKSYFYLFLLCNLTFSDFTWGVFRNSKLVISEASIYGLIDLGIDCMIKFILGQWVYVYQFSVDNM